MRVFGLMSGTSLDGIDVADVSIAHDDERLRPALLHFESIPFGADLRSCLMRAQPPEQPSLREVAELDIAAGEALASAVLRCARRWNVELDAVDAIGSHGVTLLHAPELCATLQIGEPSIIAARTGVTCVADFRRADMAAGGHGAPLVPFVDLHLFGDVQESRAALNIGGIANLTLLPAGARDGDVRAFDTGPGNMLIDACAATSGDDGASMDRDGAGAARGTVAPALLEELLDDPFLRAAPPKSTGRERYGAAYVSTLRRRAGALGVGAADLLATVTALTAHSIARQVPQGCERIIVSGGGVHNTTLMSMLRGALGERHIEATVVSSAEHGIPPDAKEAIAFAVLAAEAIAGRTNHLPGCTGSRQTMILGKVVPGKNYAALMATMFGARLA